MTDRPSPQHPGHATAPFGVNRPGDARIDAGNDCRIDGPPASLDRDTPCTGCGYNLRGLAPTGPHACCPECGRPIARSLPLALERGADARWIGRLAAGTWWAFVGLLTLSLAAVAQRTNPLAAHTNDLPADPRLSLALLLLTAPGFVGLFLFTSSPTRGHDFRPPKRWTFLARTCLPPALQLWPMQAWLGRQQDAGVLAVFAISLLLGLVGLLALLRHALWLARQLPDARLARHLQWLAPCLALAWIGASAFRPPMPELLASNPAIVEVASRWFTPARWAFALGVEAYLLLLLVVVLWSLALMVWFRDRLRRAAGHVAAGRDAASTTTVLPRQTDPGAISSRPTPDSLPRSP